MKKLFCKNVDIKVNKHPHTEQMFGGGVLINK